MSVSMASEADKIRRKDRRQFFLKASIYLGPLNSNRECQSDIKGETRIIRMNGNDCDP